MGERARSALPSAGPTVTKHSINRQKKFPNFPQFYEFILDLYRMMSMDQIMAGDVMNSLVATLAALAAGLVGAADVKHETRGGVQAAVHKKKKTARHSCD